MVIVIEFHVPEKIPQTMRKMDSARTTREDHSFSRTGKEVSMT
jgi:hypothetical protein